MNLGRAVPPLIVAVGDLMVDVAVDAPALARGGDVAGSVRLGPGGSAANVAAWAVAGGGRARLVAGRGDDLAGRLLAAALGERAIELWPEGPVGPVSGAMLVVTEAGERTFVADPGANLGLGEGEVVAGLEERCRSLAQHVGLRLRAGVVLVVGRIAGGHGGSEPEPDDETTGLRSDGDDHQ